MYKNRLWTKDYSIFLFSLATFGEVILELEILAPVIRRSSQREERKKKNLSSPKDINSWHKAHAGIP